MILGGINQRSHALLLFFLCLAGAASGLFPGDAIQFALGHEPALATYIGQQATLDHLTAEAAQQLLL